MDVAYSNAERLIRTELNAVETRASADAMKAAEFDYYQFVATLDRRTCPICGERDGEVYPLSSMNQGENAPPMHPRCRCTIVAHMEGVGRGERIAGRTRISADVSYRQWLKSLTAANAGSRIVTVSKPLTAAQIRAIKAAEDEAFRAKTGANFGFRMMSGSPNWSREILLANPPDEQYGYTPNCQRCVVAHEARMRGYDVVARPSWGAGDSMQRVGELLDVFKSTDKEIFKCVGSTVTEVENFIIDKMRDWGKRSRAFIWFDWDSLITLKKIGHVIVAQLNDNGVVNFGDPQTRKIGAVRYLNEAKLDSVIIMRVDNLAFADLVKRCCRSKG